MRGIQEVQRALTDLADTAPDGAGLLEAVRADALRIRRRRRIMAISATAVFVFVVAAGIPLAASGLGQRAPDTSSVKPYREPLQLTVDVALRDHYFKQSYGTTGSTQRIVVRSRAQLPLTDDNVTGTIVVHDPGTYDGADLLRGEPVTVRGHAGYYVADLRVVTSIGESRVPAVGWLDPSGAWMLVIAGLTPPDPKAALLRFAELVRITAPRDILVPFSLGHVPGGLKPSHADISPPTEQRNKEGATIGFGASAGPTQVHPLRGDQQLTVRMLVRNDFVDEMTARFGPTRPIAGFDVWYLTESDDRWLIPDGGSMLAFRHGECLVAVTVFDRGRIPLPELTRMLERARFADCTDPATWLRPIP